jgi:hypothetical protein
MAGVSLWQHQIEESNRWAEAARCLLWKPRTGKTRALTATIKNWFEHTPVRRVVVAAPLIVCSQTWEDECKLAGLTTFNGYCGTRLGRLEQIRNWQLHGGVLLINHDVLKTYSHLLVGYAEGLILDEIHLFAAHGAKRSQAAWRIGRHPICRFRRGATGTPITKNLGSVFSQYRILDSSIFGTNYAKFAENYLVFGRFPGQVIGYRNQQELLTKMHSISSVKTREELFDVPKTLSSTTRLRLPTVLQQVYDRLVRIHVAQIEEDGSRLVLDHSLSRLTRLAQLATGFLPGGLLPEYPDDIWLWTGKTDSIIESVQEVIDADEKVVVFFRFASQGKALVTALAEKNEPGRIAVIQGSTSQAKRRDALEGLKSSTVRCLLVQEQAGSAGISMASADYIKFASMGFSSTMHEQARDRVWAPADTKKKIDVEYFETAGTIDAYIKQVVTNKETLQTAALSAASYKKVAYGQI